MEFHCPRVADSGHIGSIGHHGASKCPYSGCPSLELDWGTSKSTGVFPSARPIPATPGENSLLVSLSHSHVCGAKSPRIADSVSPCADPSPWAVCPVAIVLEVCLRAHGDGLSRTLKSRLHAEAPGPRPILSVRHVQSAPASHVTPS